MSKRHLAREQKREKLVKNNKAKRDELRSAQVDPKKTEDERLQARLKLNAMRRDTSACRLTRRCNATGTSHSVYRHFGINRITLRNMALNGQLPGVTKSSW